MSNITLTIDGKPVTVPKGSTVLEAAEQAGIFIPTFCHDPELSKPGACRICVVEIPGTRNLPALCVTEAAEGMVVLHCLTFSNKSAENQPGATVGQSPANI